MFCEKLIRIGREIDHGGSQIDPGGSKIDPGGSKIDPGGPGGSQGAPFLKNGAKRYQNGGVFGKKLRQNTKNHNLKTFYLLDAFPDAFLHNSEGF